jgi:hypothetical protein
LTGNYVDAPPSGPAGRQVYQFWDGFDFCEVEYHTPGVSIARPEVLDLSELFVLEGPASEAGPDIISRVTQEIEGV